MCVCVWGGVLLSLAVSRSEDMTHARSKFAVAGLFCPPIIRKFLIVYEQQFMPRFVFHGCETWWSVTLKEEQRLRTFQDRVLARILGLGGAK